ncbi:hypothetical protein [Methylobacter tundripaludum]|uniref:hypothetical protein n=1 Tax=Methylobacter tundripaludum TaxID=173365 RepID=UPI0002FB1FD3|nr:hypothetical protein [Methylobacter tundripaludum]
MSKQSSCLFINAKSIGAFPVLYRQTSATIVDIPAVHERHENNHRVAGLSWTILLADSLLEITLIVTDKLHRKFSRFIPGFFPPISGLIP